jgi:Trk K+ transport system NAD-binding subunit
VWSGLETFFSRMVIGFSIGMAGGWLLGRALRVRRLFPDELKNLVVLAWVLALFLAAQTVAHESGLAAVVVAGMMVRREAIPQQHLLRKFKGELSILFISMLFILLSAHLPLATLRSVGWSGVWTVVVLMLAVRPASVLLATWRSRLTTRERLFTMWISPRGVVAISIASFIALMLQDEPSAPLTPANGEALLALVFMTIAITVVVQGITASGVARLLGVRAADGSYTIVIGADRLGRVVASALKEHGGDPLLIDTNRRCVAAAQREGFQAVSGNSLDREVLEDAQVDAAAALIATTANQEINVLAARLAAEEYGVPRVYSVLVREEDGVKKELVEDMGGRVAFGRRIDVNRWNDDLTDGAARLSEVEVGAPGRAPLGKLELPDDVLPLILVRGDRRSLCHAETRWQRGDRIVALTRGAGEEVLARFALEGEPAPVAESVARP